MPTAKHGDHLFALITFKFPAKITHTPGILTPGDLHPERSGGHVVPRWKSPDVVVSVSSGWKSPYVLVNVISGKNHPTLWLVLVWGENHLTLLVEQFILMRFRNPIRYPRIENRVPRIRENYHQVPRIREIGSLQVHTGYLTASLKKTGLDWVFGFPVNALTLYKFTKLYLFIVSCFNLEGLGAFFGGLSPHNPPCGDGTGRIWDMTVNSSAAINLIA